MKLISPHSSKNPASVQYLDTIREKGDEHTDKCSNMLSRENMHKLDSQAPGCIPAI